MALLKIVRNAKKIDKIFWKILKKFENFLKNFEKSKIIFSKKNIFRPAGRFKFQNFDREPQSYIFLLYA